MLTSVAWKRTRFVNTLYRTYRRDVFPFFLIYFLKKEEGEAREKERGGTERETETEETLM